MSTSESRMSQPSPNQARQQLDEATTRARPSHRDTVIGAAATGVLSVVVAAALTAVTFWRGNLTALAISMVIYVLAIALLVFWMSRRRVTDRGWVKRYVWGFGVTMLLYFAGIMWQSFAFPGWGIFAPFCVLVAAPGVIAAVRMLKA